MFKRTGFGLAFALIAIVCVLAFFVVHATQAAPPHIEAARGSMIILQQDGTPIPEPTASPTGENPVTLPEAGNLLLTDIAGIIASYAAITAATATVIIGFLRYIPVLKDLDEPVLNLVVNGLLVIGYWAATQFGLLDTYQQGLYQVKNIGELLLALLASLLGSSLLRKESVKAQIVVAGKQ